jgi:hypothetical protein
MVDQSSVLLVVVENERVTEEAPVVLTGAGTGGTAEAEAAEGEAAPASSLTRLEAPAVQENELGDCDSAATTKVHSGNEKISFWTR